MFNIAEYRTHPSCLSDLLPWAALVAPGVVLNKDGSFQRTLAYRGPDLESSTGSQLVSAMARLNNALKRFGSGWVFYIEAKRKYFTAYPEQGHFPDPASWLVDAERREAFEKAAVNFESCYYLTLQYLPEQEGKAKFAQVFVEKEANKGSTHYQQSLEYFTTETDRLWDILKDFMFSVNFLDDTDTLTYLHSTISSNDHQLRSPEIPMYLDAFIADTPLLGGMAPKLGDYHLRVVSILGFPASTTPALLHRLNQLPLYYRWMTRFITLSKLDAEHELKGYKRKWFSKRKGAMRLLQEVFSKSESSLIDNTAIDQSRDADEALKELSEDFVSFGYYTSTIAVIDVDEGRVQEKQREVERVINGLGFTTVSESFNAVEAWLSSLPGQAYANIRRPLVHSLNLSHLMPFSAVWSGPLKDDHLNAPPLMYTYTHGRTPFRLVNHIGDVGHQIVIGPTGSGKSVLLNMMALQFRRYVNAQVFIFDKGGSFLASTYATSGGYYEVGNRERGLVFQPLAHIDQQNEQIWAAEWLLSLLMNENVPITPKVKQDVWDGLSALKKVPEQQRTLSGLSAFLQNNTLRQALGNYTINGPFGHLLDADSEVACDENWQCYELEELMGMPTIVAPILEYLFHRLEKDFTGNPTLLILDEAWLFLDNPVFASKIRDWLKTLRKQNVSVIFATQSVEDALATNIAPVLLESTPSRILLPNDRALEESIRKSYEKLGLNDRQLQILVSMQPKREYYYQSRLGNRIFELLLGPIALAFTAKSRPEDKTQIKMLINQHGRNNFLEHYLKTVGLEWAWQLINQPTDKEASAR